METKKYNTQSKEIIDNLELIRGDNEGLIISYNVYTGESPNRKALGNLNLYLSNDEIKKIYEFSLSEFKPGEST